MKSEVLFLLASLNLASLAASAALIADWELNDATTGTTPTSAADSSGHNYTLAGPVTGTVLDKGMHWAPGQGGGSNGAMYYAGGGHNSYDGSGYLKTDTTVAMGGSGGIEASIYWLGGESTYNYYIYSDKYNPDIYTDTERHAFYVSSTGSLVFTDRYGGTHADISTVAGAILANQWTQVSVTWDEATHTANLYINGAPAVTNTSFTTQNSWSVTRMAVGAYAFQAGGAWGSTFNGDIDYVRLYDSASIPEPASLALLALGGVLFLRRRR